MQCPQCQTPLEARARFCGVCGYRLVEAGPPTSAERPAARASDSPPASAPTSVPSAAPASDPSDPYIGQTLNERFTIESKLGQGGFGSVYQGVQLATGRKVAIKLLHPEMTRDSNVLARFRREGQVLCSLRDAHTITTYDFDQTADGTLFLAMELLEGRSLHEIFTEESPIDWRRMLKITGQMCSSLHEAHELGIVHRDLKPENVYLESRPGDREFVKILDFGIAKVLRGDGIAGGNPQLTATGQTLGTLEYMSPEQLMGKELDGRSDIYGLGVLAYELMTGQLPFPDAVGPAALISAQLKKTPPPPSSIDSATSIPPEVDAMILRMLEKDRKNRFPNVAELKAACEQLLSQMAGAVPTPYPASNHASQPVAVAPSMPQRGESTQPVAPMVGPSTQAAIHAAKGSNRALWIAAIAILALGGVAAAIVALS